eukprot:TRINITY_DN3292_c0_g4_i1.p1 TRINITY_DN3292_c0_g4~~TRINITY_DN3292_c0_g4_i1.p1  ORF type:complete len:743 (+),score=91.01 TRINITY_DN3292_c0_g4_i1:101-2329(+)
MLKYLLLASLLPAYHGRVVNDTADVRQGPQRPSATAAPQLVDVDKLPLHTQGRFIVNRMNERVKWACVNLYGAESETFVAGGLEVVPIEQLASRIVELGFNCVRLPFSLEAFQTNPKVKDDFVAANPRMARKRFLDVFDATVSALSDVGLMLILDNHMSSAGWCCHMDQREGLWYTPEFPEDAWVDTLTKVTARYKSNPLVVGVGLRNEPHDWASVKLTWGDGNPETDWAMAATKGANAVLAVNPNVVITVMALCSGMCLIPARTHPIQLNVPNRLIYETHNYFEYVFVNLIPEDVISWDHLHLVFNVVTLLAALQLGFFAWQWEDLGRPALKVSMLLTSVGYWFCGMSVFGLALIAVLHKVVSNFCFWWAENGVLPWLRYPTALLCIGLLLATVGRYGELLFEKLRGGKPSENVEPDNYLKVSAEPCEALDEKEACKQPLTGMQDLSLLEAGLRMLSPAVEDRHRAWSRTVHGMTGCCLAILLASNAHTAVDYISSYDFARDFLDDKWGFVTEEGQPFTAPIWVGEFSYENDGPAWQHIVRYISERDMDFGFWAINGKKYGTGYMDVHTGTYKHYSYCDNEHGCDADEHMWDAMNGRCDLNAMEGTNCAPELSQGSQGVCSYQVPTAGQTCNAYCASKGRTCKRASSLNGDGVCSTTADSRSPLKVPEGEGCDVALPEQVCTCSMQLWRWDNETFGLLEPDYNTVQKAWRIRDLQALAQSPSTWVPRDIGCAGEVRGTQGC